MYKILDQARQEKGQYVRPMHTIRWEGKVKRDLRDITCENVD